MSPCRTSRGSAPVQPLGFQRGVPPKLVCEAGLSLNRRLGCRTNSSVSGCHGTAQGLALPMVLNWVAVWVWSQLHATQSRPQAIPESPTQISASQSRKSSRRRLWDLGPDWRIQKIEARILESNIVYYTILYHNMVVLESLPPSSSQAVLACSTRVGGAWEAPPLFAC